MNINIAFVFKHFDSRSETEIRWELDKTTINIPNAREYIRIEMKRNETRKERKKAMCEKLVSEFCEWICNKKFQPHTMKKY